MGRFIRFVLMLAALLPQPALTSAPAGKGSYPFAVIRQECAPWDGPALGIHLTKSKVTSREIPFPSVYITLWRQLPPSVNQTVSLDGGHFGDAGRCLQAGKCERATSAVLTLTAYDAHRVAGTYVLRFKNGDGESGSFEAQWQHFHERCE
jgi:hypothetical protein